jgi:hypothetical protein
MSDERYVRGGTDGWLRVRREPPGVIVSLPEYLKARVSGSAAARDQFVVLEGTERGNSFSVMAGHFHVVP